MTAVLIPANNFSGERNAISLPVGLPGAEILLMLLRT
jgi:hypothetical protein